MDNWTAFVELIFPCNSTCDAGADMAAESNAAAAGDKNTVPTPPEYPPGLGRWPEDSRFPETETVNLEVISLWHYISLTCSD